MTICTFKCDHVVLLNESKMLVIFISDDCSTVQVFSENAIRINKTQ